MSEALITAELVRRLGGTVKISREDMAKIRPGTRVMMRPMSTMDGWEIALQEPPIEAIFRVLEDRFQALENTNG